MRSYKNGIVCAGKEKGNEPINTAVFSRNFSLTFELVVLTRCLLYWSMLWNFGEREGPVGSILSCLAEEVPSETGPSGQVKKL